MAETEPVALPRAGETWQWHWLWAEIVRAGPKRVTYTHKTRIGWETSSVPTEQFMARFHKTSLTDARLTPPGKL